MGADIFFIFSADRGKNYDRMLIPERVSLDKFLPNINKWLTNWLSIKFLKDMDEKHINVLVLHYNQIYNSVFYSSYTVLLNSINIHV